MLASMEDPSVDPCSMDISALRKRPKSCGLERKRNAKPDCSVIPEKKDILVGLNGNGIGAQKAIK